ncbi:ATP-binding cassette domain-containing protein [Leptolyngbya sp. GGD]|uniref:ATP-binding cassette domain-containing protein n=1 Tax=Leptolyngbya sp. GGD TaxID=2997907 RepID=UPI00227B1A64|nr:ATP-binding cassette domain-containing protein [Leptolyngbya sp. GGD]MCY6494262.1 ATP-binding cassette domain-containing protein [Leptolyngbya sp. GGD]
MSQTEIQTQTAYLELNNQGQTLRFTLTKAEHRLGRDDAWADLVIPVSGWEVISSRHAVLRREGDFYWIYDGDESGKPSTNGLFINHTRIKPQTGFCLDQNVQLQIGQNPQNAISLVFLTSQNANITAIPNRFRLNLSSVKDFPVQIGREPHQQYGAMVLNAPTISRCHATIERQSNHYILRDHSANGTYVNKQRVTTPVALNEGDTIQIGPYTLILRGSMLEVFDRGDQIRLDAHQLTRKVLDESRQERTILNNVSLAIEPGQLVALVGGSGAGKSTLMKTLLGIAPTTSGAVHLNGDNLRRNFDLYRSEIGYVPQDDIVHLNLTVEEVLTYACRLRLPPDTNIQEAVTHALEEVKLSHVRNTLVQRLSGGQRKRVSIAVELLANPKLFFLDEPTSGLDPGLDKKMMELLRELADQGRTIVLVTHATSNLEVCDRIAFMGMGGRLCYFGPPKEAMRFFQAPTEDLKYFADIYIQLGESEQAVEHWSQRFHRSQTHDLYVKTVLSTNQTSLQNAASAQKPQVSFWQQWLILCQRSWKLILRDRFTLILMMLTAPVGIGLLTLALQDYDAIAKLATLTVAQASTALRVLFVFTCAALWVGLSSTAQSIVQENHIYYRERLVNLRLLPYLGSKFSIHAGLAVLQTVLIVIAMLIGFRAPQPELLPWTVGSGITTFLTLLASVSLGLMISALVKNSNQANSTLPLILIPQIIFSGILFKLEGAGKVLSWLMVSRWSIGAYGSVVDVNAMVPQLPKTPGVPPQPLPFDPNPIYDPTWANIGLNWGLLALHSAIYLGLTFWLQKRKDVL